MAFEIPFTRAGTRKRLVYGRLGTVSLCRSTVVLASDMIRLLSFFLHNLAGRARHILSVRWAVFDRQAGFQSLACYLADFRD